MLMVSGYVYGEPIRREDVSSPWLTVEQLTRTPCSLSPERVIPEVLVPHFDLYVENRCWDVARRILEFVRDLHYQGPQAEEFYQRFFTILSGAQEAPEKTALIAFLAEARRDCWFLVGTR